MPSRRNPSSGLYRRLFLGEVICGGFTGRLTIHDVRNTAYALVDIATPLELKWKNRKVGGCIETISKNVTGDIFIGGGAFQRDIVGGVCCVYERYSD